MMSFRKLRFRIFRRLTQAGSSFEGGTPPKFVRSSRNLNFLEEFPESQVQRFFVCSRSVSGLAVQVGVLLNLDAASSALSHSVLGVGANGACYHVASSVGFVFEWLELSW